MRKATILIWVGLLLTVGTAPTWAWLRMQPNWPKVAQQAEVIVVGHVAAGDDLVYVPRDIARDGHAMAWEFHGFLTVDEVIRGEAAEKRVPIVINYGLTPSRYVKDGKSVEGGWAPEHKPGLALFDTGSSSIDFEPFVDDLLQPAIWLLSHHTDEVGIGQPTKSELLGVQDPNEVLPMTMLPFIRTLLLPDPGPGMIELLGDNNLRVRQEAMWYLYKAKDQRAVPKALTLMKDPDWSISHAATLICQELAGPQALPGLRAQLADETQPGFANAVAVLAALHDRGATPRLLELAKSSPNLQTRGVVVGSLGTLGDPAAIPLLIADLQGDLWEGAQSSLLALTGCRLSPNGDKAVRWWQAAQNLPPETWRHFALAQRIASFLMLGPDDQEQTASELRELTGGPVTPYISFSWVIPSWYQPLMYQQFWQKWLKEQNWTDYQGLPSQIDGELVARAEPTATVASGQAIHLKWTVTNVSPQEVWLCREVKELAAILYVKGGGIYRELGSGAAHPEPRAEDFVLLKPGESLTIAGKELWHGGTPPSGQAPAWVSAGLVLTHKGTAFGHDAWVGELWAAPITLAPPKG